MKLKFIIDPLYEKRLFKSKKERKDIDVLYKATSQVLPLTKRLYQTSWNEIGNIFSAYVEKTTGYNWFYKSYECVLSVDVRGESNWGNAPKIMFWWKENPCVMRNNVAYELILSHYFEIHKRNYKDSGLTDGQIWALAEIAAMALTSLTPEVKMFWPWDIGYYTCHNYPHILEIQNKLKNIFLNRKDFDEYITAGIRIVRAYPNMSPAPTI